MNKLFQPLKQCNTEDLHKAIEQCDLWFTNQETNDEFGRTWIRADDLSIVDDMYPNPENYHTGTAGMIPYFLYRYNLYHKEEDLQKARDVAERLIATKDLECVLQSDPDYPSIPLNIYGSRLGEASAVMMLYEVTKDEKYKQFILEMYENAFTYQQESGTFFGSECLPMAGDSGTLLFLTNISKAFNLHHHDQQIRKSAAYLLSKAQESDEGYKWYAVGPKTYWPGIECGTAGVAYALCEAGDWLKEKEFINAAEKGATHLMNIAIETEGNGRLFYVNDFRPTTYYLGHCHGSVGISKFFYALYLRTGKEIYKTFLDQMVNGILSTGAPEYHSSGYWNNTGFCCGTAGLLKMFLGLYAAFNNRVFLDLSRRCASEILGTAFKDDGQGMRWYQGYIRVKPWKVGTQNGQIIGNAGIASALMEYLLATKDEYHSYRFAEDPYPSSIK